MPNRLAAATSPYLLQHADNPVDWWEWGDEAFAEARRRDVPVLISVGYAACHWCHVMAHESFEDEQIAESLNAALRGGQGRPRGTAGRRRGLHGGHPGPDRPRWLADDCLRHPGGRAVLLRHLLPAEAPARHAVVPPAARVGRPDLARATGRGVSRRSAHRGGAGRAGTSCRRPMASRRPPEQLDAAVLSLSAAYDRQHGGFGGAPKFPPSMVLELLLRHHARTGDAEALRMVEGTCEAMARGGIYDQLGGGFARYAVDAGWVVPHFEKMLYDNALLLRVYTHLWRATGSAARAAGRRWRPPTGWCATCARPRGASRPRSTPTPTAWRG